jgi:hypothetical protein
LVDTVVAAGVKRVYGLVGRSRPGAVFCIANRLRLFRNTGSTPEASKLSSPNGTV